MSTARDSIFADIRRALGPAPAPADDIAADLAAILADPAAVQPKFDPDRLEDRFIEKATSEKVTATLTRVATLADIPVAVAAYLDEVKLPHRIALQPSKRLTALDWAGIETHHAPSTEEPVSLTMADYAIAETGSMVFRSREDAPVLFNFLPLHHLVAVAAETILPRMEDYWRGVVERGEAQPRATNIITGTSGTADIEAKNVRGAHGPRHMRILLIGGK